LSLVEEVGIIKKEKRIDKCSRIQPIQPSKVEGEFRDNRWLGHKQTTDKVRTEGRMVFVQLRKDK